MTGVLCIENARSKLAATKRLHASGEFETVTATSERSARGALRAIPRIRVTVLSGMDGGSEQQLRTASLLEEIRPGLPKLVLAAPPAVPANLARIAELHMSYCENERWLLYELQTLTSLKWGECREAARLDVEQERQARTEATRWMDEVVKKVA